jgi:predicted RNase H-like nuclease (RuvC/YqgF family)
MTDRVTVNFDDEVGEWITEQVENGEYESKSRCVEEVFLRGRDDVADLEDRVDELEERLESREERIDELESQLRRRSNIENEIESVAETVEGLPARIEDTESYSERRQRKLDQAGAIQRIKWKFTGVPVEDD